MGQDYSYSQPSSSEDYDYIFEAEAALYADEADSRDAIAEASDVASRESIKHHNLNMNHSTGFVNLLHSQSSVDLESSEPVWFRQPRSSCRRHEPSHGCVWS
ncbi:unnamed protein product [Eruca vesicaria subsp. sativa]|uniref:Uncharacterized protein n=1 Tax=Eruca vesicaria subsp. sativa TaxID=29727 RepID=A0ABC8J469_ERUVS|nr:unnamed protein product [Eruca vesicaria subsp. sativa]